MARSAATYYKWSLVAVAALVAACGGAPSAGPEVAYAPEKDLLVAFTPATAESSRAMVRQRHGAVGSIQVLPHVERWRLPPSADLAALAAEPAVRFVHRNRGRRLVLPGAAGVPAFALFQMHGGSVAVPSGPTNDPGSGLQWHLRAARFPEAWARGSGEGVTVAVIDSGVDPDHPDLAPNLLPMIDEIAAMGHSDVVGRTNYDGRDGHGHGTHVSGLIAAVANNERGVAGAAPLAKILPLKVTATDGETDDATIARGIGDAVEAGARVLNLSIGGPDPSPVLLEALNFAFERGATVVIAAGNDAGPVNYPAAYRGVIAVGATTQEGEIASYSSRGAALVLVAPGGGAVGKDEGAALYSTMPTYPALLNRAQARPTGYGMAAGTSMAAPLVSAAAALVLGRYPSLSGPQVRTRLAAAAGGGGRDDDAGYGALDAARAVDGP